MNTYVRSNLNDNDIAKLRQREVENVAKIEEQVRRDVTLVKKDGDSAVRKLTRKYDGADLVNMLVSPEEIKTALDSVPENIKKAFAQAAQNIEAFHSLQLSDRRTVETMPGVTCFSEMRPIEKVGLYIPGGTAPLASTVLMLGIPAKLAGCKEIVMITPPNKDGSVSNTILFSANLCGITTIYKGGGAQAIAAMAYGTESVPKVDKIFGPGNDYVTQAKKIVSADPEGAAIDMPAGPTEVLVIADDEARADFVASDLLSQAEHATNASANLVCVSNQKAAEVLKEIDKQLADLPRREIAKAALEHSFILISQSTKEAVAFANTFAPEHLIVNTKDADDLVPHITNAGSVFIGPYSCESAGDYASGTNHCLPTYGYARVTGGVSVASFQKQLTFQTVTPEGARQLAPIVSVMAEQESLDAHKRAMKIRAVS
jgi:histidinol dehydrogenase